MTMEDDLQGITILLEEDFNFLNKVEVGRGGCAKTFQVEHLGEKRALKKPNRNTKLCAREIAILNDINHENIVRLFGIVHYDGSNCIVMELAENGSLYDILYARDNRPFTLATDHKHQWIAEVAAGLQHLHLGLVKPVVHGDVKSPNVLIFHSPDDRRTAKLADFGLSEELEVTAEGGDEKYSCRWAAPETVKATHKSTKSDVWSYGATVWEIWMEQLPYCFLGCHSREVESRIILGVGSGDLMPYSRERDKLPPIYDELLMNCFVMDHKKRWTFQTICEYLKTKSKHNEGQNGDRCESKAQELCADASETGMDTSLSRERYIKAVTQFNGELEKNSRLFLSVKNLFRDKIPKGALERIKTPFELIDRLEAEILVGPLDSALLQTRLRLLPGPGHRLASFFSAPDNRDSPSGSGSASEGIEGCIGGRGPSQPRQTAPHSVELAQEEMGRLRLQPHRSQGSPERISRPVAANLNDIRCVSEVISPAGVEQTFDVVAAAVLPEFFPRFARNLLGSNHRALLRELRCCRQGDRTREMLEMWVGQERSRGHEPTARQLVTVLRQTGMERTAAMVEQLQPRPQ